MSLKCAQCSAAVQQLGAIHCPFCGALLPADSARAADPQAKAARLRELVQSVSKHPEFAAWLAHEPKRGAHVGSSALGVFFGLLFAAAAAMFLITGTVVVGPLIVVPIAFLAAGLWVAVRSLRRTRRFAAARTVREPAFVLDKQVRIHGASNEGPDQRTTYLTLESENGARREVRVPEHTAGLIALGDYGLAYTVDETLLDFRRVGSA